MASTPRLPALADLRRADDDAHGLVAAGLSSSSSAAGGGGRAHGAHCRVLARDGADCDEDGVESSGRAGRVGRAGAGGVERGRLARAGLAAVLFLADGLARHDVDDDDLDVVAAAADGARHGAVLGLALPDGRGRGRDGDGGHRLGAIDGPDADGDGLLGRLGGAAGSLGGGLGLLGTRRALGRNRTDGNGHGGLAGGRSAVALGDGDGFRLLGLLLRSSDGLGHDDSVGLLGLVGSNRDGHRLLGTLAWLRLRGLRLRLLWLGANGNGNRLLGTLTWLRLGWLRLGWLRLRLVRLRADGNGNRLLRLLS